MPAGFAPTLVGRRIKGEFFLQDELHQDPQIVRALFRDDEARNTSVKTLSWYTLRYAEPKIEPIA